MERITALLLGRSERRTIALAISLGISLVSILFGLAALVVLTRLFSGEYIAVTLFASSALVLIVAVSIYIDWRRSMILGCIFALGCFTQYWAYLVSFAVVTLYGEVVRLEFFVFSIGLFLIYRTVIECESKEADE